MLRFASGVGAIAVGLALAGGGAATTPAPPSGAELAALAQLPVRTSLASQRIYFVMTDRYANGDPSNDRGGKTGPRGVTGFDPTDAGAFHGGDFRGLTGDCTDTRRGLARVKALGFTALWVTPPFGQKAVQGDSAAYHGYWITDFTSVDPHLGTDADFGAFVACAHSLGLKVYLDVVVNHTADVIALTGGSSFLPPDTVPYRDCHGRKFVPARYAGGTTFPCLKASNMPRVPLVLAADRNVKKPAWLNDVTKYHDRGDVDFSSCSETCLEQGDFYGLDDLFTEQPAVVRGLAAVYGDWIRRYKLDGFRVDTARHVDRAFFHVWTPLILKAARDAGVDDFPVFGEVFVDDAVELSSFVRDRGLPNVLDFPFQDAAAGFAAGQSAKALANRLDDDDYFRGPSGVEPTPPTFLGNHDMGRAAFQIQDRSGAHGDELLRRDLLGHALLYLLRGAPVVMYGDEVGMIGRGGDKQARQDMFPTAVAEWRTQERVGSKPIGSGSSFDLSEHPVAAYLRGLASLRDRYAALATGATIVRLARKQVLVVSRIDPDARREYLVAFNSGKSAARVDVATATPRSVWRSLLSGGTRASSSAKGHVLLRIPSLGGVALRADAALPARPPVKANVRVDSDPLSGLRRISAMVPTSDPVTVTFAVRAAGRWQRLAVDDSPPYRAFAKPRRGALVVVAIVRSSDGRVAVSSVMQGRGS